MYRVFRLPAGPTTPIDALYKDDLVARQSLTVRAAGSLGLSGEGTLILVEGSETGVVRAEELLKDIAAALPPAEAETAYRAFRAQDEDAAAGMGFVFGE